MLTRGCPRPNICRTLRICNRADVRARKLSNGCVGEVIAITKPQKTGVLFADRISRLVTQGLREQGRLWQENRHTGSERRVSMRQQLSNFKAEFFKALAHPLRISILDALREGELTVNEISQRFAVEPANASQQLAVLRNRNIVMTRKDGANVYYSVSDKSIFKLLDAAKEIFSHHLIGVRSMLEEIHAPAAGAATRATGRKG